MRQAGERAALFEETLHAVAKGARDRRARSSGAAPGSLRSASVEGRYSLITTGVSFRRARDRAIEKPPAASVLTMR